MDSSSSDYNVFGDENDDLVMCEGSQVYTLASPMHIVCLILNIFLPGWGTMISASACTHATEDKKSSRCSCGTFTDGMFQFYLSPVIFGWIWSIVFGIAIYRKGRDFHKISR